jgi:NitT/TauT family transport system substrate-binding protein
VAAPAMKDYHPANLNTLLCRSMRLDMQDQREQTMKRLVGPLMALLCLCSAAMAQEKPTAKAVLLLNWYVYSEHAPFFLGLERGYFSQEGIDLQIQEGRGSVPTVQAVANGTADFGYADVASAIKAASQGAPVVTTGVLLQKSPMALIGLTERNIRSPADMRGKTVALTPGDSLSLVWPLLLKKMGLKEDELTIVSGDPQTKLNAVINGRADLMLGYLMDQNLRIEKATGKPVTAFRSRISGLTSSVRASSSRGKRLRRIPILHVTS